jgi:GT2 family glycosyltransferase
MEKQPVFQGGERVCDPEFKTTPGSAGSIYWQLRAAPEDYECTPLSPDGGLSLKASQPLRLENGAWGSRLWLDDERHRIAVEYSAGVALRLELRSEGAEEAERTWTLPAGDERQSFGEDFETGDLGPERPFHLVLSVPDTGGRAVKIHRISVSPTSHPDLPKVAVGIATFNRKSDVTALLRQLREIDYPQEAISITVVDNASTDGTAALIREQHPEVHVLTNPQNLGGSGGFNRFFQHLLESEELPSFGWLIDDDARIDANTLKNLVRVLLARSDAAIAGSVMMDLEQRDRAWEAGGQLFADRFGWDANLLQQPIDELRASQQRSREVGYAGAYSLLFRPEVLRTAGLWRNYFLHVDDSEWCYRVRAVTGDKVLIAHDSLVWHALQGARKPFTALRAYETRNFLHYFASHGSPAATGRVLRECLGMALRQLLAKRRDLCDFHLQGIECFFQGRYGRLELERCALQVESAGEIVAQYRDRHGADPRCVIVVCELNDYANDGDDHEAEIMQELRACLPSCKLLSYGHRDLSAAGADGRMAPPPESRGRTLLHRLRGILWPRPGIVVLPFWNQSVAVNNLARLVAVYEEGAFSIYEMGRFKLFSSLLQMGARSLAWSLRARMGRYTTQAAEVSIPAAKRGRSQSPSNLTLRKRFL